MSQTGPDRTESPFLASAVRSITRPEDRLYLSSRFLEEWLPRLGNNGVRIIIYLKTFAEQSPVRLKDLAAGVGASQSTIRRELANNPLLSQVIDKRAGLSYLEAERLLCAKIAQQFTDLVPGLKQCQWCKGKTCTLQQHHYPVPKSQGGTETVALCPNCHTEFHRLIMDEPILMLNEHADCLFVDPEVVAHWRVQLEAGSEY